MEKIQGNTPSGHRRPCIKSRKLLFCSLAFLCLLSLYFGPSFRSRVKHCFYLPPPGAGSLSNDPDEWCPLPNVTVPSDDGLKPSEYLMDSQHQELQVQRLSAAVKVPTESYDDNGDVDEDPRWETFQTFHNVLEQLFPLV